MKKSKVERLERELDKVKELVSEFKKQNGNSSLRISNKDILLLLLTKSMDTDKRIGKLEGRLAIIIPIVFGLIGLNITGVI